MFFFNFSLLVPKHEVVVATKGLMLALDKNDGVFRMDLEEDQLTGTGAILNTAVNRSSPLPSTSLFRSYSLLHKQTPQSASRFRARRNSVSTIEDLHQTTKPGHSAIQGKH